MFSREIVVEAFKILRNWDEESISWFALRYGLEKYFINGKKVESLLQMTASILNNKSSTECDRINTIEDILSHIVKEEIKKIREKRTSLFSYGALYDFESSYPELCSYLKLEGYIVTNDGLQRELSTYIHIESPEDEIQRLLRKYDFQNTLGKLELAVNKHEVVFNDKHNGRLINYMESLVKEIEQYFFMNHPYWKGLKKISGAFRTQFEQKALGEI
ncbi:hypothetical protein [Ectobacillus funiculus]|uniref:hypothetical protein n=1 Tax=Ectobacillus funiculus TaxID=137993 RepID=UPI00101C09FF|nr:hypothetical protein [Ectobacillus funiculus]